MEISKGKRIVHFCNYSPLTSGIYPETRDLIYEELRVGYDSWLIDHTTDAQRDDPIFDSLYHEGRVLRIEEDNKSATADLICWHSWIPEQYMKDRDKNLVMFLHAMPSHLFYNEIYGGEKVLSFLKKANTNLPHCHYFITLWPSHRPYWENIFNEKLVTANPIIDCQSISLKQDLSFDPDHLKLAMMDSWRGGKEPYYIFNAVQILMEKYRRRKIPYKVTLNIYGQGVDHIQPVWHTLMKDGLEKYFLFKGRDYPQKIFDSNDILLTQGGEINTESRVIREGLLSGIPIISGISFIDWTDFKHDCRDIKGYADQIQRCWETMQDLEARKALHRQNREFACNHYDIQRNVGSIFQCYEKVFDKTTGKISGQMHAIDFGKVKSVIINSWDDMGSLDAIQKKMKEENPYMSMEEAVISLMIDLPKSI